MATLLIKDQRIEKKEVHYEPSIYKNIVDRFGLGFSFPGLFTTTTLSPRTSPPLSPTSARVFITAATETRGPIDYSEWRRV
jgi:hypothetical protein